MKLIQLLSFATLLIAPFVFEGLTLPAFSADRSDGHALALSHRYGAYTHRGNIAAGQTLVIDTPEGSITCTGALGMASASASVTWPEMRPAACARAGSEPSRQTASRSQESGRIMVRKLLITACE